IDILVNASRQVLATDPLDQKEDGFELMFQQNVLANLRLTQAVAKRMIKQAADEGEVAGAIVNLSSIASERSHPKLMSYSVACAALNQLTRSLAVSLAKERIRVNAIAIGSVMSASLQDRLKGDPETRAAMIGITPLGRIADAGEIAEVAQFLSSDSSGFITGQIITVDGGRTLIDPMDAPAH
ncbi:MAG: SDR family oxidoreductase, partial [Rhodobacteraceae bacterium]|nr:SDR family oxidoreductase [Paracoccaceae bacterium]